LEAKFTSVIHYQIIAGHIQISAWVKATNHRWCQWCTHPLFKL
jgi:hypothetical protein